MADSSYPKVMPPGSGILCAPVDVQAPAFPPTRLTEHIHSYLVFPLVPNGQLLMLGSGLEINSANIIRVPLITCGQY